MKLFNEYVQLREVANINAIVEKLDKIGDQTPYQIVWNNSDEIEQKLGLTPEEINFMKQHDMLVKAQNGWKIDLRTLIMLGAELSRQEKIKQGWTRDDFLNRFSQVLGIENK